MKAMDSTFLIDLLRGIPGAVGKMKELKSEDQLITTQVNIFELSFGIYYRYPVKYAEKILQLESVLDGFIIFDLTYRASLKAAQIAAALVREGQQICVGDALIAGILLANGCNTIVTNDSHFERVEGLTVESY